MADLYIDAEVLNRTRSNLMRIAEILQRPAQQLAALDEAAVGAPVLRERTAEFAEEWSYGIGQLGKFAAGAAEALTRVGDTFQAVDVALAQVLSPPP